MGKKKHWWQVACGLKEQEPSSLAGCPFLSAICPTKWMGDNSLADPCTDKRGFNLPVLAWHCWAILEWKLPSHSMHFQNILINLKKEMELRIHCPLDEEKKYACRSSSLTCLMVTNILFRCVTFHQKKMHSFPEVNFLFSERNKGKLSSL